MQFDIAPLIRRDPACQLERVRQECNGLPVGVTPLRVLCSDSQVLDGVFLIRGVFEMKGKLRGNIFGAPSVQPF